MSAVKDLKKLQESILDLKQYENKIFTIDLIKEFSKIEPYKKLDRPVYVNDFLIETLNLEHVKDFILKNARKLAETEFKNECNELKKIIYEGDKSNNQIVTEQLRLIKGDNQNENHID